MKKLILLSDLWGKEKPNWILQYTIVLEKYFDVKYYDCCELGGHAYWNSLSLIIWRYKNLKPHYNVILPISSCISKHTDIKITL